MHRKHILIATFAATSLLVACGGGGGGGSATIPGTPSGPNPTPTPTSIITTQPTSSTTPAQTATPTTTATPTSLPTNATVSGTVVDFATNTALNGVNVWTATTHGGPYTLATATTATGTFSFNWTPGQVLYLQIGTGNTTATQATLHAKFAINNGPNVLTVPTPPAVPNYVANAAQLSGHFRLMTLSSAQTECLTAANQGRTNLSLPLLVPDEILEEMAVANVANEVASNNDVPTGNITPSSYAGALNMGASNYAWSTAAAGSGTCASYTGTYSYTNTNPPWPFSSSPMYLWYGSTESPNSSGSTSNFAAQYWAQP